MLLVVGRIPVKAQKLHSLLEAASLMTAATSAEAGCAGYTFAVDIDQPLILHLHERWESDEALTAHFATAHFRVFGEVLLDAVDGPADFVRYDVASAAPLFG